MHSKWQHRNDFLEDIWMMSEIEGVSRQTVDEPPPPTILEYNAQMTANNSGSIYDRFDSEDEDVTRIISGRGRGGISTILKPGVSRISDARVAEDVQRKIREVSGLGYSNELIEQGFRAMTMAKNEKKNSPTTVRQTPNLVPSPSSSASPSKNSNGNKSSEKELSFTSSSSSLISNSPAPSEENSGPPTIPLSVMRKQAEKLRGKSKNTLVKADEEKKENISNSRSPVSSKNGASSGDECAWRRTGNSSSDECSWRRRGNDSPNRFFQKPAKFNLKTEDFPALK